MGNIELVLPNKYSIEILKDDVANRIERLNLVVVDPDDPKKCEDLRTETNNFIKEIKSNCDELVKTVSQPALDYIQPYIDTINELALANKDLSERILNAKKQKFKDKVRDKFIYLAETSEDGVLIPFEEIYQESWYGKTEREWFAALCSKVHAYKNRDIPVDRFVRILTNKAKYDELINYLKEHIIGYEEV